MESFGHEVVIIEGVSTRLGIFTKDIVNELPKNGSEFQKGSESLYAVHLARNFEVPFVGAEPSPNEIMKSIQNSQAGYCYISGKRNV